MTVFLTSIMIIINTNDTEEAPSIWTMYVGAYPDNVQVTVVTETITHFLFECQAYDKARHSLVGKIGRSRFTVPKIMKNTDHMKALVTFIGPEDSMKTTDVAGIKCPPDARPPYFKKQLQRENPRSDSNNCCSRSSP